MEWIAARDHFESLRVQQAQGLVESPADGKILETLVSVGDYVQAGDTLVWLEHAYETSEPQLLYGCVPVETGALLKPGCRVTIEFPSFGAQNYGSLVGRITEVSQYAVSPENLRQVIKNASLVQYLLGGQQAVIAVRIAPELNPEHVTGYVWEGGQGPPGPLTSGMVGTLKATVKRVAPITYVLPGFEG
jgi:HlyD family secretion protein